jgi:hypothetical protein
MKHIEFQKNVKITGPYCTVYTSPLKQWAYLKSFMKTVVFCSVFDSLIASFRKQFTFKKFFGKYCTLIY